MISAFGLILFMSSLASVAKTKVVAIEGVSYHVNFSIHDNLKFPIGKKVSAKLGEVKPSTGFIDFV